ncbi:MAG: CBS domain-containing protein [Gammaproteobacteria bacterium]|nr:CBS domain-containing protein [Gammaproteobacteria bacterium]
MNELVRDWMTATVITVAPTTTIDEADDLMQSRGIRRLAVIEDNLLAGIVSQGDIRAAKATASADLGDFRHTPTVGAIMTPNPITIPESASVALAAKTMLQLKLSGLPVVNQAGEMRGILSESDLFRFIVELAKGQEHRNAASTVSRVA